MRYIIFVLFISLSTLANASDIFVRPISGGPYGGDNGTSYNNAYDGFVGVAPSAGDTVHVCGEFGSADTNNATYGVYHITQSGTSETARIIIDGDCSEWGGPSRATLDPGLLRYGISMLNVDYVTLRNFNLIRTSSYTATNSAGIRVGNTTAGNEAEYITVEKISIYDQVQTNTSYIANGVWGYCNYCVFQDMEIYGIPTDGMWFHHANGSILRRLHIYDVAKNQTAEGDCVQITYGSNMLIEDNVFDHSSTEAKNTLLISDEGGGVSSNNIVRRNIIIQGTNGEQTESNASYALNLRSSKTMVYQNYIYGGEYGYSTQLNDDDGNVIRNNVFAGSSINAIYTQGSGSSSFLNNTIVCSGTATAIVSANNTTSVADIRKFNGNIIHNCATGIRHPVAMSDSEIKNNLFSNVTLVDGYSSFDVAENFLGDAGLANSSGIYSFITDFVSSSSIIVDAAGTDVIAGCMVCKDATNKAIYGLFDIGAIESDLLDTDKYISSLAVSNTGTCDISWSIENEAFIDGYVLSVNGTQRHLARDVDQISCDRVGIRSGSNIIKLWPYDGPAVGASLTTTYTY